MSDHLTPERLADIRGAQREEWSIYPDDVDDLLAHIDAQAAIIQRVRDLHQCERRYQREGAEDAGSFDTPAQVIYEHEDGTEEDENIKVTYFEICAECGRHESAYARTAGLGGDDWGYETAMWPCETKKALDGDR